MSEAEPLLNDLPNIPYQIRKYMCNTIIEPFKYSLPQINNSAVETNELALTQICLHIKYNIDIL